MVVSELDLGMLEGGWLIVVEISGCLVMCTWPDPDRVNELDENKQYKSLRGKVGLE